MAAVGTGSWDAVDAIRACPTIQWSGEVWRCHSRRYPGDSANGSLRVSGRFNRGRDRFLDGETWPALYTSLGQHIDLGERLRQTSPEALAALANQRISRLRVDLQTVLLACAVTGCHAIGIPGLTYDDLCHPHDYAKTQEFTWVACQSVEALFIPTCTRFPEGNLIIFPDRLHARSGVHLVDSQDPDLFVDWSSVS